VHRELVKKQSRDTYRKGNPRKDSAISRGLLGTAVERELRVGETGPIMYVASFTIPESAAAIARSTITLKRWIRDKLVPPPVLMDTSHGYLYYSEHELKLIAKILVEHAKEFDYLHCTHTTTINQMWQAVEASRKRQGD
jgi:hypothetical protein